MVRGSSWKAWKTKPIVSLRTRASSSWPSAATSRPPTRSDAGGRPVQRAEQVHERRLAGPGRSDHRHVVARLDRDRHPAQRLHRARPPARTSGSRRPPPAPGRAGTASWVAVRTAPAPPGPGRRRGRRPARPPGQPVGDRDPSSPWVPTVTVRLRARPAACHPDRVPVAVPDHRGRRHRDRVLRRPHPQVGDRAHARPRLRRRLAVGQRAGGERQPHPVAHPAAGGRRRATGRPRRRSPAYRAPGTASSSASALTPGLTRNTSVSSTSATSDSTESSTTVASGVPGADRHPLRHRPDRLHRGAAAGARPPRRARTAAWSCTSAGSWPSTESSPPVAAGRAGPGADELPPSCTVPPIGVRTSSASTARSARVHRGLGLHPLGRGQRGQRRATGCRCRS